VKWTGLLTVRRLKCQRCGYAMGEMLGYVAWGTPTGMRGKIFFF